MDEIKTPATPAVVKPLPDVQATKINSISINRVGVSQIDFPLKIEDPKGELTTVNCKINLYGSLPKTIKGTNMSRFMEVLMEFKDIPLSERMVNDFQTKLIKIVETKDVYAEIEFDYFIDQTAPVTKKVAPLAYKCTWIGRLQHTFCHQALKITVPVTSLCPCSKKMSKYGAHNQRGYITAMMYFDYNKTISIAELVGVIQKQGSCMLFPILKREDEKWVTEYAYRHPKFVEDIARGVSLVLQQRPEIRRFRVKVENHESIHQHNAIAYIFRKRKGKIGWVIDEGDE
jgi:GTP cyclohydrolase I